MATHKKRRKKRLRCIVIAGPNGAGKTTFAREYLPKVARVIHFVNADLIAGGLSPLKPELAAIAAARIVLREVDRLATERADFAFETTLSGRTYVRRIEAWKRAGYRVEIVFLRLDSSTWHFAALKSGSAKVGMMCPSGTSSDASSVAGKTSKKPTIQWRNLGRYTTIPGCRRNFWRGRNEGTNSSQTTRKLCRWSRAGASPGGEGGA
jgi:hypothetical protein